MAPTANPWLVIQRYFTLKVLTALKSLDHSGESIAVGLIDRLAYFTASCGRIAIEQEDAQMHAEYIELIARLSTSNSENDRDVAVYCEQFLAPLYGQEHLLAVFKSGIPQLELAFGRKALSPFEFFAELPDTLCSFSRNLFRGRIQESQKLLDLIPAAKTHLDIGGGPGAVAYALANSSKKSTIERFDVYDLPDGVKMLSDIFTSEILPESPPAWLRYRGGSFFSEPSSPSLDGLEPTDKYEQIHLGLILHDWSDATCSRILSRARSHLEEGGRLIIYEFIRDLSSPSTVAFFDIMMLLAQGGRERSFPEFRALLVGSGFHSVELVDTSIERKLVIAQ